MSARAPDCREQSRDNGHVVVREVKIRPVEGVASFERKDNLDDVEDDREHEVGDSYPEEGAQSREVGV